jgi:hypothetical protein
LRAEGDTYQQPSRSRSMLIADRLRFPNDVGPRAIFLYEGSEI